MDGDTRELAYARVDLGMAIRAEHHALRELSDDPLPRSVCPVGGNPELFRARVQVVELERRRCEATFAATAGATEPRDRAELGLAAQLDDPRRWRCRLLRVPPTVAVRANEVALFGFRNEPLERPVEYAHPEVLRSWVAMMKLQCLDASRVPAVDALTAASGDQGTLSVPAPLAKRPPEGFLPPLTTGKLQLFRCAHTERKL